MNELKISSDKENFEYKGKKFFYLADTVWSIFTNTTEEEWEEYLVYRKKQGFNVLQINILPQWDRSFPDLGVVPFDKDREGNLDFSLFNYEYFLRTQKLLQKAVDMGFIPALVILWCDFVPDTWATNFIKDHIMPLEAVKPYTEHVVKVFEKFNPIYMISGDTDFKNEVSQNYYLTVLRTVKKKCPDAITTMHLAGTLTVLPEIFMAEGLLDFYMYQSGHGLDEQSGAYTMAEEFCKKPIKIPVLNGEPCYEGAGHKNGRFNEFDIRKATWQSILAGGKAGVTYGAHGIWSWHKKGNGFPNEGFARMPYDWRTALTFRGAWDVSLVKKLFETYDLFDIKPSYIVLNDAKEIRAAKSEDNKKVVFYIPYNIDVEINFSLIDYELVMINLENKYCCKPEVVSREGKSVIKMHDFNADVVVIGIKNTELSDILN